MMFYDFFYYLNKICYICELKEINSALARSKVRKWPHPWQYWLPYAFISDRYRFRTLRWLRVSPQSSPSASLKCKSRPSWCHHSSLPRQRRTTCNGGPSLCGNPPGASVGRSPAPWRRSLSCSPSPPTSQAGGSTRRSPWWLPSVFTAVVTQTFTECVFLSFWTCEALFPATKTPNSLTLSRPPPTWRSAEVISISPLRASGLDV